MEVNFEFWNASSFLIWPAQVSFQQSLGVKYEHCVISYFTWVVITSIKVTILVTRPIVNYAKDWLYHLFPFPDLVWPGKGFHLVCQHCGAVNNYFPVYWTIFGMVTCEQPNGQPGDPSASLLWTDEKAVFSKKRKPKRTMKCLHLWGGNCRLDAY